MKKLEEEPETFQKEFTKLTKGINLEVQKWIMDLINPDMSVAEIGCGTGNFAIQIAKKGCKVIAIDANPNMIAAAQKTVMFNPDLTIEFKEESAVDMGFPEKNLAVITSTFMLSELRPFEQQIFLRNTWSKLKDGGSLIVAAEFEPSGFWRIFFLVKRWWFKKKLRRLRSGGVHPLKWFINYIEPIGFQINSSRDWDHGAIRAIELKKISDKENQTEPGYYQPKKKPFRGVKAGLDVARCILTGQIDHLPLEPGIYKSGNPDPSSPILVTSNYIFTYIKVMRDIEKIDAWVLCVDSRGINVWCAARGPDFGNSQLIEAVNATDIKNISEKKLLYLPQLSAGGVAVPELPKKTENFPFSVKYGPIWSKDLPEYLEKKPSKKPDRMKFIKFNFFHRMRAFVTHSTFLLRKIFLTPALVLLLILLAFQLYDALHIVGDLVFTVIFTNLLLALVFPILKFTRRFIIKGIVTGIFNVILLGVISWTIYGNPVYPLWNLCFCFWMAIFSTMSFSGYTFSTGPREIEEEYSIFRILNIGLLLIGLILSTLGIIFIYIIPLF